MFMMITMNLRIHWLMRNLYSSKWHTQLSHLQKLLLLHIFEQIQSILHFIVPSRNDDCDEDDEFGYEIVHSLFTARDNMAQKKHCESVKSTSTIKMFVYRYSTHQKWLFRMLTNYKKALQDNFVIMNMYFQKYLLRIVGESTATLNVLDDLLLLSLGYCENGSKRSKNQWINNDRCVGEEEYNHQQLQQLKQTVATKLVQEDHFILDKEIEVLQNQWIEAQRKLTEKRKFVL